MLFVGEVWLTVIQIFNLSLRIWYLILYYYLIMHICWQKNSV